MVATRRPTEDAAPADGPIRPFAPGTLWARIVERSAQALASGALAPIETEESVIEDGGVRFRVRCVSSLARKAEAASAAASTSGDPFLPPDPALLVAEVSRTHLALLNKFPVIAHHLLIVTRAFEEQERLLTLPDFEALARAMAEFESLGFYNGGFAAGASQAHKHLQWLRLPLAPEGPAVPLEALFGPAAGGAAEEIRTVAGLPFVHALAHLEPRAFEDPARAAQLMYARYQAMLPAVGISAVPVGDGGPPRQSAPYNLLATRRWLLIVPRTREHFEDISINALGFAGSLFVRNRTQLERLRAVGPFAALRAVAVTYGGRTENP